MLTEVVPSDQQKANVEVMLRELRHDKLDGIGVLAGGGDNPGTSMHIKRWDLQNYADLSKRLLDEFPVSLFLLGGVSERELNDDLIELIGVSPGRLTNLAGRVPLAMLPAFLQRMKCVIGGDSGPLHLAAAVGTPTVILFGPSDPRLVAPLQKNSVHVWKRVHCSPCYTPETVLQKKYLVGNKFVCWTGTRECLNSLTVEEVYDVMRKMLRPAVVDSV
jgi:ADP-heptose:LPS heptosyltransferase